MRILVGLLSAAALYGQVVISQVYGGGGNTGATLRNDFIELFNRGDAAVNISGWSIQYASATGGEWQRTDLNGTLQPGQYYLIQQAAGAGGTADLPTPDATGTIAMSGTAAKVALVRSTVPLQGAEPARDPIADLVGYGTANFFEKAAAPGLSNTTAAIRRQGGCADTDDNSADFQTGAPIPRNALSERRSCAGGPPAATFLRISEIQGKGDESPATGQLVMTRGVVTARRTNGFYLQSRGTDADDDAATSEGIFVFTAQAPPAAAAVGAVLTVQGTVVEFRPASDLASPGLTEIVDPVVVETAGTAELPAAVALPPPGNWERYEGMRVSVPRLRVVSPGGGSVNETTGTATTNGVFFGVPPELARPLREPGITLPDPVPNDADAAAGRFDANPEKLRVDSRAQGGAGLSPATGMLVTNLRGPLDFGARTYTMILDAGIAEVSGTSTLRAAPAPADNEWTAASMNLQRLFDDRDDPGKSDAVLTPAAYQARLRKIARQVREVLRSPDVIGVQEAENIDVLRALAREIGGYEAQLVEGNDPGGIDVGLLIKADRVRVVEVRQEGRDATHLDGRLTNDRPPLLARLMVTRGAQAMPVTVIVNHLRSNNDLEDERVRAKRRAQAEFLARLIQQRRAADASERIVVMGDFNAYPFSDGYFDVMGAIEQSGLTNLTKTLPRDQSYSYIFNGDAQAIDHVLVSASIAPNVSRHVVAHLNADFPEVWRGDPERLERASDHDAPVTYFQFEPLRSVTARSILDEFSELSGAIAPGQVVRVPVGASPATPAGLMLTGDGRSVTTELSGYRVLFDGTPAPLIRVERQFITAMVPFEVAGKAAVEVRVESRGQPVGSVIVPVEESAPQVLAVVREGAVMVLYATGAGVLDGPRTGEVARSGALRLPYSVRVGGEVAVIEYAGQAPGQLAGVVQINARVTAGVAAPVQLDVGGKANQPLNRR